MTPEQLSSRFARDDNGALEDRRRFIALCGAAIAAVATGCIPPTRAAPRASDGRVRVSLADHPELSRDPGIARIRIEGTTETLLVIAAGAGAFTALSPVCTHRGCTVEPQGARLVCPCHGSTFDRGGQVVRGPAELPLRSHTVTVRDGMLEIAMESR
jgi:cytochrome b6-f complex iron-sulfur subunit